MGLKDSAMRLIIQILPKTEIDPQLAEYLRDTLLPEIPWPDFELPSKDPFRRACITVRSSLSHSQKSFKFILVLRDVMYPLIR